MAKLANKTKKPALAHLDTEHLSVRAIDISVYVMTSLKWHYKQDCKADRTT